MDDKKEVFLGEDKVIDVQESEFRTPNGAAIKKVTLEDGKILLIPEIMFSTSTTDKPIDATSYRDKRMVAICAKIMDVLAEYDLKMNEWDYASATVQRSIHESFRIAEEIKWGTASKSLLDIDRVLNSSNETKKTVSDILDAAGDKSA